MLPSASTLASDRPDRHRVGPLALRERDELRAHGLVLRLRARLARRSGRRRALGRGLPCHGRHVVVVAFPTALAHRPAPCPLPRAARRLLRAGRRRRGCAHHRRSASPGGSDLGGTLSVDPADREPRLRGVLRGMPHELDPDGLEARLRRRLVDRADAEVVDVGVGVRCLHLRGRVGREADQHLRARPAGARSRRARLPGRRHAVGVAPDRKLRPVVHHEQCAGGVAELAQLEPRGHEFAVRCVLVAKLHDVDAAPKRGSTTARTGAASITR